MTLIQPPIIVVDETGCASYFLQLEDAVMSIESPDVEFMRVYDAQGRIINLEVSGEKRSRFFWIFEVIILGKILPSPTSEFDEPALRKAIVKTLSHLNEDSYEEGSLPQLLEMLMKFVKPGQ